MNVYRIKTICYVWYILSILCLPNSVGSNPIIPANFDPLRSRANGFIIDTKHLKLVRSNSIVIGLDPVQDHHL